MSGLLSHRINTLLLDANRAFPSQVRDSKEMLKEWRRGQRCRIVVVDRGDDPPNVTADRVHHGQDDES